MMHIFSRLLDVNQREISRIRKVVEKINALESKAKKLKDTDFPKETEEFKRRIKNGETLEDILPEAFALFREASSRALGQRPYDVQLLAGIALFEGKIVEQKTGEGKTLTAGAPLYLRALSGRGVHLVTVNDYLARVGAGWNAPIYRYLGLTVGVIVQEQKSYVFDEKYSDTTHGDERLEHLRPSSRKEAYEADVTYGTNNEYGFDYLRDNMTQSLDEIVQREHYFAIVDEVDSILIDEARTPLIISAPDMEPTDKYYKFASIVEKLQSDTDFTVDEKTKSASLTEQGISRLEKILGIDNLYEKDWNTIHHVENALRAKTLYLKNRDYVVKDNQIIIVDEFTGRLMFGRRWSDGLHQAVEAKEGVGIKEESKTLATISFQNYFRMYKNLAGMTGTAVTEADEFKKIYNLDVIAIPTHRPMVRKDHTDLIYKTLSAKYAAIVSEIEKKRKKGQPVLVGTTSIEKNEILASLLKRKKIPHNILNAKNHEKEAMIIADAGKAGAVTVATNMAGRGVDIILGGAKPGYDERNTRKAKKEHEKWEAEHKKVVKAGGLHVIGTERHDSRRIDNQLRGRAGRQGDPGSSRFYLSLEDDLMRIFAGEQIKNLMNRLRIPDDMPIENVLVARAIEQAQGKVESFNFDIRKRLVEFDDVANQQRDIIYKLRKRILSSKDVTREITEKLEAQVEKKILLAKDLDENIDHEKLAEGFLEIIPFDDKSAKEFKKQSAKYKDHKELLEFLIDVLKKARESRQKELGKDTMRQIEKFSYLSAIDQLWMDHIDHIDGLRESINLRAYGQRDPLVEFKNEAYPLFERLVDKIDEELAHRIFRVNVTRPQPQVDMKAIETNIDSKDLTGLKSEGEVEPGSISRQSFVANVISRQGKVGRNDPCPCGSGLKYKKCGLIGAPEHKG